MVRQFYFKHIDLNTNGLATGPALHENFMELTPLGVPVEFDFDMNAFGSAIETKPENILSSKGKVFKLSSVAHHVFHV